MQIHSTLLYLAATSHATLGNMEIIYSCGYPALCSHNVILWIITKDGLSRVITKDGRTQRVVIMGRREAQESQPY